ncbi:hypothetical protein PLESTM_000469500 [Pleodorina starrii]|nr:hypothetical protein PLESTM_000469500 [Pleodorina starrii]
MAAFVYNVRNPPFEDEMYQADFLGHNEAWQQDQTSAMTAFERNNLLEGGDPLIQTKPDRLVLHGKIALGELNLICGIGGSGKSTFTAGYVTTQLKGGIMAGEYLAPFEPIEINGSLYPPKALFVEGEGRINSIKFLPAGMENGLYLDGHFFRKKSLLTEISERLADPTVCFVVIDSLMTLLHQGNTGTNDGKVMKEVIMTLYKLAVEKSVTILLIHHANKKGQELLAKGDPPNTSIVSGAGAITNIPRQVTTIKSNCAESGSTTYINMDIGQDARGHAVIDFSSSTPPPHLVRAPLKKKRDEHEPPTKARAELLAALSRSGPYGSPWDVLEAELTGAAGLTRKELTTACADLENMQLITSGSGRITITKKGQQWHQQGLNNEQAKRRVRGLPQSRPAAAPAPPPVTGVKPPYPQPVSSPGFYPMRPHRPLQPGQPAVTATVPSIPTAPTYYDAAWHNDHAGPSTFAAAASSAPHSTSSAAAVAPSSAASAPAGRFHAPRVTTAAAPVQNATGQHNNCAAAVAPSSAANAPGRFHAPSGSASAAAVHNPPAHPNSSDAAVAPSSSADAPGRFHSPHATVAAASFHNSAAHPNSSAAVFAPSSAARAPGRFHAPLTAAAPAAAAYNSAAPPNSTSAAVGPSYSASAPGRFHAPSGSAQAAAVYNSAAHSNSSAAAVAPSSAAHAPDRLTTALPAAAAASTVSNPGAQFTVNGPPGFTNGTASAVPYHIPPTQPVEGIVNAVVNFPAARVSAPWAPRHAHPVQVHNQAFVREGPHGRVITTAVAPMTPGRF